MRKANGVNYSKSVAAKSRRERVIVMLEKQLKSGVKTKKIGDTTPFVFSKIILTESDVKRINKELETLKSRV